MSLTETEKGTQPEGGHVRPRGRKAAESQRAAPAKNSEHGRAGSLEGASSLELGRMNPRGLKPPDLQQLLQQPQEMNTWTTKGISAI